MNEDEETGLRAFTLTVDAAGPNQAPQPRAIERSATRIPITAIEAQWQEEERRGYRVRLADGTIWLLYYVPELDLWSGIAAGEPAKTHD